MCVVEPPVCEGTFLNHSGSLRTSLEPVPRQRVTTGPSLASVADDSRDLALEVVNFQSSQDGDARILPWPKRRLRRAKADRGLPLTMAFGALPRTIVSTRPMGLGKSNVNDISSPYAQTAKGIHVARLDHRDKDTGEWREILLECRRAEPAETAAARIDFGEWLGRLSRRRRRIAEVLASGESTNRGARRFRVSPGRISQVRRELKESWDEFQSEARSAVAVA